MGFGIGLIGAGLGALGGAMNKKPPGAGKYLSARGLGADQQLWSPERQQGYAGAGLDYLQNVGTGKEIGISQGELGQLTGAARKGISQGQRLMTQKLMEGALASGQGARGGALQQNIMTAGRNALDAQRGVWSNALNFALQQRAADRDRALRANEIGFRALGAERGLQSGLAGMEHQADVARSQVATGLRGAIQGAAAGMGAAIPGYQQMGGGAGGAGGWKDFFFGNPFARG